MIYLEDLEFRVDGPSPPTTTTTTRGRGGSAPIHEQLGGIKILVQEIGERWKRRMDKEEEDKQR